MKRMTSVLNLDSVQIDRDEIDVNVDNSVLIDWED